MCRSLRSCHNIWHSTHCACVSMRCCSQNDFVSTSPAPVGSSMSEAPLPIIDRCEPLFSSDVEWSSNQKVSRLSLSADFACHMRGPKVEVQTVPPGLWKNHSKRIVALTRTFVGGCVDRNVRLQCPKLCDACDEKRIKRGGPLPARVFRWGID